MDVDSLLPPRARAALAGVLLLAGRRSTDDPGEIGCYDPELLVLAYCPTDRHAMLTGHDLLPAGGLDQYGLDLAEVVEQVLTHLGEDHHGGDGIEFPAALGWYCPGCGRVDSPASEPVADPLDPPWCLTCGQERAAVTVALSRAVRPPPRRSTAARTT